MKYKIPPFMDRKFRVLEHLKGGIMDVNRKSVARSNQTWRNMDRNNEEKFETSRQV
jgi:hypothetical protein